MCTKSGRQLKLNKHMAKRQDKASQMTTQTSADCLPADGFFREQSMHISCITSGLRVIWRETCKRRSNMMQVQMMQMWAMHSSASKPSHQQAHTHTHTHRSNSKPPLHQCLSCRPVYWVQYDPIHARLVS